MIGSINDTQQESSDSKLNHWFRWSALVKERVARAWWQENGLGFVTPRWSFDFVHFVEDCAKCVCQRLPNTCRSADHRPRRRSRRCPRRRRRYAVSRATVGVRVSVRVIAEHKQVVRRAVHLFLRHVHSLLHFARCGADEIRVHVSTQALLDQNLAGANANFHVIPTQMHHASS